MGFDQERDLLLKISQTGAEQVGGSIHDLISSIRDMTSALRQQSGVKKQVVDETKREQDATARLSAAVRQTIDDYTRSYTAQIPFIGGLRSILGAVMALPLPIKLATAAVGVLAVGIQRATSVALQNAEAVKQLSASSGLGAEQADNLSGAWRLLGGDAYALQVAMFRMTGEIAQGGKGLAQLGISIRDGQGNLKTEGTLFLELRDKLSEFGSSTQRNAALIDIFGSRFGRQLIPVMAKSREEFKAAIEESAKLSPWTEKLQKQTLELAKSKERLSLAWEGIWVRLAPGSISIMQEIYDWFGRQLGVVGELIDAYGRLTEAYRNWLKLRGAVLQPDLFFRYPEKKPGGATAMGDPPEFQVPALVPLEVIDQNQRQMRTITMRHEFDVAQMRVQFREQMAKQIEAITSGSAERQVDIELRALAELRALKEKERSETLTRIDVEQMGEQEEHRAVLKFAKELEEIDEKINLKRAERSRAALADFQRAQGLMSSVLKARHEEQLTMVDAEERRAADALDGMTEDRTAKASKTNEVEERAIRRRDEIKLASYELELFMLDDLLTRFRGNKAVEEDVQKHMAALEVQRLKEIADRDAQVLASRRKLAQEALKMDFGFWEDDTAIRSEAELAAEKISTDALRRRENSEMQAIHALLNVKKSEFLSEEEYQAQRLALLDRYYALKLTMAEEDAAKTERLAEQERRNEDARFRERIADAKLRKDYLALQVAAFGQEMSRVTFAGAVETFSRDAAQNIREGLSGGIFAGLKALRDPKLRFSDMLLDVLNRVTERAMQSYANFLADSLISVFRGAFDAAMRSLGGTIAAPFLSLLGLGGGGLNASAAISASMTSEFLAFGVGRGGVLPGHFESIRAFAGGGIARTPTLGMVAEAGRPEAVIPLADGAVPVRMSGGNVVVNVIDKRTNGSGDVQVEERKTGGDTRTIDVIIRQTLTKQFGRGEFDQVLARNFGLNRRPVMR